MSVTPLSPHPLCPSQGAPHDPQKKKEEKGLMPWLGLLSSHVQSQSLPKLQPSPSSGAKLSHKS